jgi:hypothetical protein
MLDILVEVGLGPDGGRGARLNTTSSMMSGDAVVLKGTELPIGLKAASSNSFS